MWDWLDELDSPTDYLIWDYPGFERRLTARARYEKMCGNTARRVQSRPRSFHSI